MNAGDQYLKYIAERPRSHGLFSNTKNTSLDDMMQEVNSHTAPVWTFIYSLKREDAVQLGTTPLRTGGNSSWLTRRSWRRR